MRQEYIEKLNKLDPLLEIIKKDKRHYMCCL